MIGFVNTSFTISLIIIIIIIIICGVGLSP
jgi:hypothetical protein